MLKQWVPDHPGRGETPALIRPNEAFRRQGLRQGRGYGTPSKSIDVVPFSPTSLKIDYIHTHVYIYISLLLLLFYYFYYYHYEIIIIIIIMISLILYILYTQVCYAAFHILLEILYVSRMLDSWNVLFGDCSLQRHFDDE